MRWGSAGLCPWALAACLLGVVPAAAATRYDPQLRFRSLDTPHFVIHYHQGEEAAALRLSAMVEAIHEQLSARLGHEPRGRTHVVLVDQADDPNGWATPLPYNLIEIAAAPPPGTSILGNTDDWLRLVFTHEYTHILHLDQSRGWARAVRTVFGRTPLAFPNLTLPLWHIEGLATYEESRGGQGRVPAGDFRAVVREPARAGAFEPLDRVNGGLVDWPGGTGWYAYGAYFHEYLARRFGDDRVLELTRRTARRAPYFGAGAFEAVFGAPLGSLWRDFAADEAARASRPTPAGPAPERLTHHGFVVSGPRVDHDGSILYSRQDAHEFPAISRVTGAGRIEDLATRYGGEQLAPAREALYFDQLELQRSVSLTSDVYRFDRATGDVRRLTRGARLTELDLSPDGRRVAAVQVRGGARALVVLDRQALDRGGDAAMAAIASAATAGDDATVFANPRWSPDGRRLAVERRRVGGRSEVVLVDPATGHAAVIVSTPRGRNVTPEWMPEGDGVVFASDRDGPFDLYRVVFDASTRTPRRLERLTRLPGGARSPHVTADGRRVVFVGYTPEGSDLFMMPMPEGERVEAAVPDAPGEPVALAPVAKGAAIQDRPYRPWSTLLPRTWIPVLDWDDQETRAGAAVGGFDALGYHAWSAAFSWSVAREVVFEPVAPGGRPDVVLAYAYDRWRPTLFAQYADETTPLLVNGPNTPVEDRRPVALRERSVDLGVSLPFRRVRLSHSLLAGWRADRDVVAGPENGGTFDRSSLRLGWTIDSSRRYGYSISRESGAQVGVSTEVTREALGADGNATFTRADARVFLPAVPRHAVLAVRATGAGTGGDGDVQRVLRLGGAAADAAVLSFDEDASSLLRGFPSNAFAGRRVALINAEYRVPIVHVQRGLGTWPLFVRSLHASGFVDVGHAWSGQFQAAHRKLSWGAEVATDVTVAYALPMTWTMGVAWGRDGAGRYPDNREVYVRLGHGF